MPMPSPGVPSPDETEEGPSADEVEVEAGGRLPVGPRRRPRDRSAVIARHAAELFARRGYHAVHMEDIAAACGVTVRALYRHYPNKQALLSAVIHNDQDRLLEALAPRSEGTGPHLETVLRALADAAVQSINLSPLWQREARHLADTDFATVRHGLLEIVASVRDAIERQEQHMEPSRADLRAWATVSVLTSVGPDSGSSAQRRVDVLIQATLALITAPPPVTPAAGVTGASPTRESVLRREQLLRAAAAEFRRSGYGGVALDAIGSKIGVVGPAIYRYFPRKAAVLSALIDRFQEWTAYETLGAIHGATRDDEVLDRLVSGYIRLAVDATDLLAVAVAESAHLDRSDAEFVRRWRADQIEEWAHWLQVTRATLRDDDARLLVSAARAVVDDLARTPHLARLPQFPAELSSCLHGLLHGSES